MTTLIKNALTTLPDGVQRCSLLIKDDIIAGLFSETDALPEADAVIDASDSVLLPGAIDCHVHFREPGLTHKATIATESRAAVAGGVTTIFDMPNCVPQTVTLEALEEKCRIASTDCVANWSFYLGATNDNTALIERLDPALVCGVKLFMGSSTGGMLVDSDQAVSAVFKAAGALPVAAHCEDTALINSNMQRFVELYGDDPDVRYHHLIRSEEACWASSSKAVELADKAGARLHMLHVTTARELSLFDAGPCGPDKKITAEACPAHLMFTYEDTARLGTRIKCNPAVKTAEDRAALRAALIQGRIDTVGTDHAPHLLSEKQGGCRKAASGMPVLPYSLPLMLGLTDAGVISLHDVARLMSHNPATIFQVHGRGFIKEGYKADLVLVRKEPYEVADGDSPSLCGWSPFSGMALSWKVRMTWVNGHPVFTGDRPCPPGTDPAHRGQTPPTGDRPCPPGSDPGHRGLTPVHAGERVTFDR